MSNPFIFDADIADLIIRTRSLSDDLARILADGGPSDADLVDAPFLDRFVVVPRMRPALAGIATGHPILGDRRIVSSELFAIDCDAGWARTFSRFYRIGRPAGAARGRDQ
ncbi:DUF6634 family protein [Methylocystis sp. JAN1]|uniref:DUF6634 family protein n=1 Tax=Methylocystis sp. JAN1 TaxID=3397211 RepID=UPI003FA2BA6D